MAPPGAWLSSDEPAAPGPSRSAQERLEDHRQLDRTIRSFERTLGVVAHADSAQELKRALAGYLWRLVAIVAGVVPFLLGDLIKAACAGLLLPGAWKLVGEHPLP